MTSKGRVSRCCARAPREAGQQERATTARLADARTDNEVGWRAAVWSEPAVQPPHEVGVDSGRCLFWKEVSGALDEMVFERTSDVGR